MGWILDGMRADTDLPWDHVSVIPAGASMRGWWNGPVDFACLYFTPASLTAAAGEELTSTLKSEIRPAVGVQSPTLCKLVRALHDDAAKGHPYGKMLGESIFVTMAALIANDGRILRETASVEALVIGAFDGRWSLSTRILGKTSTYAQ